MRDRRTLTAVFRASLMVVGVTVSLIVPRPVPADHLPEVTIINADQLKAWIDAGRGMLLVDSRVTAEYEAGHIPTAMNIPATSMDQSRGRFPSNREQILIFYCNGWPQCKKSHEASAVAVRWGYRHVYWFRDGLPAWQAKHYPIE
jgi:rhodanese-related sulfurtransferase